MTVPSYDDLTPSIPDVVDSRTVSQLEIFLRGDIEDRTGGQEVRRHVTENPNTPDLLHSCLYACLRLSTVNREPPTVNNREPSTVNNCEPLTVNRELLAIARDFSPRIMCVGDGEVLLDVSGLGRLIGDAPAIAKELRRAIAGAAVDAHVAIAPTQTAARLLATGPGDPAITASPGQAMAPLPVARLQPLETLPPAMNHRDRARPYETFARWGITTLGDLAALPAADLASRLGRRGAALQRLARGLDPRPFVPDLETPRYIGRLELEWPIETLEPLSFAFARLLEPLSAALERADRGAAAIRLDLRLADRTTHARVLQLPAPIRDARVLRTLLLLDLESSPLCGFGATGLPPLRGFGATGEAGLSAGVDVVAIELDPAPARITQFSLLERALPSPETLSTLIARLAALVGETRVGSPGLLDSHAPDAFELHRYAPESDGVGAKGAQGASGATGAGAAGAASGGGHALVLRRQRVPLAIRVSVAHGRPVHLASSRRGMPQGAVIQAAGPWRSSGEWWTQPRVEGRGPGDGAEGRAEGRGPRDGAEGRAKSKGCWNRDEWDVALKNGVACRISQDRTTERWFLDGLYD